MNDFLRFVLSQLKTALVLAMLGVAVGGVVLAVVYGIHRKRHGKGTPFPWGKTVLYFLLAGYLAVLGYATLLRFFDGWREISFHPFRAWREAWNDFSFKSWANVLLNVALFVPAGFLLPLQWKGLRKGSRAIPACFALSLGIELLQLAFARGVCDVDDLIANTLGGALGFFLVMAMLGIRKRGQLLRYGALFLGLLAVLALPFGIYGLKTYGNLPDAPAYRLNTSKTQWSLACELPVSPVSVPVYRTETVSKSACAEMYRYFADLTGSEQGVESYYQEMAYYNLNPGGILQVYYHDGSWEYLGPGHWDDTFRNPEGPKPQWKERTREQVEEALTSYPCSIPGPAEFLSEGDGWYQFSCDRLEVSDTLWAGTLRCRLTPEGEVMEILAKLIPFTYHSDAAILTAEQAWQKLQKGWFKDNLGYAYRPPMQVNAAACVLSYTVDTKGFYQPVWEFQLTSDNGFSGTVMIPAVS